MSAWLKSWRTLDDSTPLLVCLAQAGAACGQFRPWQQLVGETVTVAGVQLPGREERWSEPYAGSLDEVVEETARALLAVLRGAERPVAIYGHSLGGLIGFELAHRLEAAGHVPAAVVVAGCRPPLHWTGAGRGLVSGEDDDAELRALLAERELEEDDLDEDSREWVIQLLRADAALTLGYRGDRSGPLRCPVEAWGGDDDAVVTPEQLDGWVAYGGGFTRRRFPGGHWFHADRPAEVTGLLTGLLTARNAAAA